MEINGVPWSSYKIQQDSLVMPLKPVPASLIKETPPEVIQWVVANLSGYQTRVLFPRVNRDGSGTKTALSGLEASGYQLTFEIKSIVSRCFMA